MAAGDDTTVLTDEQKREIHNARNREWRAKNPEKLKQIKKRRREKHGDEIRARERELYQQNIEAKRAKARASVQRWRDQNKEIHAARQREWYARNRDSALAYRREYCKQHHDEVKTTLRNCSAKRRNAEGNHTRAEVAAIRKAQHNKCAYCGEKLGRTAHLDHITPIARGGTNWPNNLQWLCAPCNHRKHCKDPIDYAQSIGLLL